MILLHNRRWHCCPFTEYCRNITTNQRPTSSVCTIDFNRKERNIWALIAAVRLTNYPPCGWHGTQKSWSIDICDMCGLCVGLYIAQEGPEGNVPCFTVTAIRGGTRGQGSGVPTNHFRSASSGLKRHHSHSRVTLVNKEKALMFTKTPN